MNPSRELALGDLAHGAREHARTFVDESRGVAEARVALAKGSRSFALAGKLLPANVRDDAAVVYAFCRRADDLVDEPRVHGGPGFRVSDAVAQLARETDRIYQGLPQSDRVLGAFQQVVFRRGLPREAVDELIAGFAMDARPTPQMYETWDELLLYSFRVAGTVGLMMCRVMGARDPRAERHAAALGMGMQLTNIARDVAEDWARGRLYIPREALPEAIRGLRPEGILTPEIAAQLRGPVAALLDAAEPFYRWGDGGLRYLDGACAVGVRAARLIYSDIGRVVRAQSCDVRRGRAVVSGLRKIWLAARAAVHVVARRNLGRRVDEATLPALPGPLPAPFTRLLEQAA